MQRHKVHISTQNSLLALCLTGRISASQCILVRGWASTRKLQKAVTVDGHPKAD